MKTVIRVFLIALVVIALGAVGYRWYQNRIAAAATADTGDFTQVVAVQRGDISASVSVVGALESLRQATLSFDRLTEATDLLSLDVAAGNTVSATQTLAAVDPAPYQQALDQAKSSLADAEATLADLQTPATALDIAKADLAVAQSELKLEQARDALQTLTSPDLDALNAKVADAELSLSQAQLSQSKTEDDTALAEQIDTLRDREADLSAEQTRLANESYSDQYYQDRLQLATNALLDTQDSRITAELNAQISPLQAQMQVRQAGKALADAREALADAKAGADSLELAAAQQAVAQAEADLEQAKENRADLNDGPDAVALATAQANVEKQRLAVADTQTDLDAAILVAPFAGTVLETYVAASDRIDAGAQILTLADMSALQVVASVDETTIRQISVGQKATITFDAFPTQTFRGEITAVPLQGALQGGVMIYDVKISLQGAEKLPLLVGMTANITINTGEAANVLLVPTMAVQTVNGLAQVLVPTGSDPANPTSTPVEVGLSNGTYTQIVRGLNEGDQVVIQLSNSSNNSGFGNIRQMLGSGTNRRRSQ